MSPPISRTIDRRTLLEGLAAGAALAALPSGVNAAARGGKAAVLAQVPKMHAENLKHLQDWIALPSIAAEDRNYPQGAEYLASMLRDLGFGDVRLVPTSGKPGVFGYWNAGAKSTVAVYIMYDVKQFVPAEWRSPPLEAALVKQPGLGTVCMGRGAVNQKGPQNSFFGALRAFNAVGQKPPVNIVLVAEGEEEIGSPHFGEIVADPQVLERLKGCSGVLLPSADQGEDGGLQMEMGAKGIIELELVSSGEKWGRGPGRDVHSSLEAAVDSPSWHLVQALNTLVQSDGHTPAVDGLFEHVKPLSEAQRKMVLDYTAAVPEETVKKELSISHWVHDLDWQESQLRLYSQPTINIEGLVGGYTGPGGKTVLPHRATAKIDMRLVPDMTAADTLAKLKAHLAKRGFGDIEVNMTGGYDPTQSDPDSKFMKSLISTYKSLGTTPLVLPRSPGSWPGYRFTSAPLSLPAGSFGLGYGTGAHAPDEFYLIESDNPKVKGLDGAVASFVECLYALA